MMCKSHEVCAVQHFTEPKMTMPVCIPLSFVPGKLIIDLFSFSFIGYLCDNYGGNPSIIKLDLSDGY